MAVGRDLIERKKYRHGLFFVHLALEKALKAHVCRATGDTPPRIHNLVRLCELARLQPTQIHLDTFANINDFNIEGRYPLNLQPSPNAAEAQDYLDSANEVFRWLNSPSLQ